MTPPSKQPAYANRYAKLHRSGYRLTVDATVTRRMAQALMAIGYTRGQIGGVLGFTEGRNASKFISGKKGAKVYPHVAAAMAEFYEAHHMKPLTTTTAKRVIASARKSGYIPPMGWDSIESDERPHVRRAA